MSNIVIKAENISKHYNLGTIASGTLYRDVQSLWARWRGKEDPNSKINMWHSKQRDNRNGFWALKDVSFEIKQGDVVGIIGRNGAGKSTLLKILSRVTGPTTGSIKIKGRVASLLEVGTGFHPELTGRENVYLNGTILGMRKREIDRKFAEIIEFAEIEKFIDTPVKRYSSGMYVRLAFAVAAHLDPEILVVDEVLAVGDAKFQKKCLGKMGEVSKSGKTVLFVSHNMPSVQALCSQGIFIDAGKISALGPATDVIEKYIASNQKHNKGINDVRDFPRTHTKYSAITEVWLESDDGVIINEVKMGSGLNFCFRFQLKGHLSNPGYGFGIEDQYGKRIFSLNNYLIGKSFDTIRKEGIVRFFLPELMLLPGDYFVSFSIVEDNNEWIDFIERALPIQVIASDIYGTGRILEPSQGIVFTRGNIEII